MPPSDIESVEQLEVLFQLWRMPERGWTSDEVATAVYCHPSSVVLRLAEMAAAVYVLSP